MWHCTDLWPSCSMLGKLARITSQSIGHVADVQFVQQKHVHCARNQMGSRNNFYVPIHSIQPGVPSPINLIETAAEEIRSVLDVIVFVFLLVFVRRRERRAIEQWIAKEIGRPCCSHPLGGLNSQPSMSTLARSHPSPIQYHPGNIWRWYLEKFRASCRLFK